MPTGTCTTLDHVYPRTKFGQRCYCGARTFGQKGKTSQKKVDNDRREVVESPQSPTSAANSTPAKEPAARNTMTLTLKGTSKNGKQAFYTGARNVVRIPISTFVNGAAPPSFDVQDGVFEGPKVKMTAEERKAARANAPKPTKAEKAAKLRERLARLEAAAAAEAAAGV